MCGCLQDLRNFNILHSGHDDAWLKRCDRLQRVLAGNLKGTCLHLLGLFVMKIWEGRLKVSSREVMRLEGCCNYSM